MHATPFDLPIAIQLDSEEPSLERHIAKVAHGWRRAFHTLQGPRGAALGQIDGIVESLLEEMAWSLTNDDHPVVPWTRTHGLLRLSASQGAAGLQLEFDLLKDAIATLKLPAAPMRRVEQMLDAAKAQAYRQHQYRQGKAPMLPLPFGGVVVETR